MSGDYTYEEQPGHVPVDKQTGREIDHAAMQQLQREVTELNAHVWRVRDAVTPFMRKSNIGCDGAVMVPITVYNTWVNAFNETPAQSLTDHDRQVAERVREYLIDVAEKKLGSTGNTEILRNTPLDLEDLIK